MKLGDIWNNLSVFKPVDAEIRDDIAYVQGKGHSYDVSTGWYEITERQHNEIWAFINGDQNYNIATSSCVHFASDVAKIANVDLPYNAGLFATPQKFADKLEDQSKSGQ